MEKLKRIFFSYKMLEQQQGSHIKLTRISNFNEKLKNCKEILKNFIYRFYRLPIFVEKNTVLHQQSCTQLVAQNAFLQ